MNELEPKHLRALANMLPEKLCIFEAHKPFLFYKDDREVKPAEYLSLCWEIEETLTNREVSDYMQKLDEDGDWFLCHATPQQRITALAAVKNVEVL